eukprot:TRINITY_DN14741_c0_g2_i1.p1 TRINITY_DN14741_c0_g2~~TRINITY_DN14741_c0_g2_i1.p1  ORF type:complete len:251 (+),score=68.40 TRINITY_DN14741_c0_g2_i1:59-811(+)
MGGALSAANPSQENAGWQGRLCAAVCAPPLPKLRFDPRNAVVAPELQFLRRGAWGCLALGVVRAYLNQKAVMSDFMGGGTDTFAGILGLMAAEDCCGVNGTFYVMFLVWAVTNAILFDLILSLGGNLATSIQLYTGNGGTRAMLFWTAEVVTVVAALLQLWMAARTRRLLNQAIPGWFDQISGSSSSSSVPPQQQPLLGGGNAVAPAQQRPMANDTFRAFGGSGQRLGASGASGAKAAGAGSAGSRLLAV